MLCKMFFPGCSLTFNFHNHIRSFPLWYNALWLIIPLTDWLIDSLIDPLIDWFIRLFIKYVLNAYYAPQYNKK